MKCVQVTRKESQLQVWNKNWSSQCIYLFTLIGFFLFVCFLFVLFCFLLIDRGLQLDRWSLKSILSLNTTPLLPKAYGAGEPLTSQSGAISTARMSGTVGTVAPYAVRDTSHAGEEMQGY